jgi:DNA-directed RNA polymerase sigma subunit (sigma70/sigma32)
VLQVVVVIGNLGFNIGMDFQQSGGLEIGPDLVAGGAEMVVIKFQLFEYFDIGVGQDDLFNIKVEQCRKAVTGDIKEYKSLDKYFNEIDKIDLISTQEEVMLARKIREGDQQALERLTKTNLHFVVSVAKQYQNQGLTLGDLINEGNIGLIVAAKRYDETKGFKFISYAVWWIPNLLQQQ